MVSLYIGYKIIDTREGSNNVVQQFIHGAIYIDELVLLREYAVIGDGKSTLLCPLLAGSHACAG